MHDTSTVTPALPADIAAKIAPHLGDLERRRAQFKVNQDWQQPVTNQFPVDTLGDMADVIDGCRPITFVSHRPIFGPLLVGIKRTVTWIGYRVLKLCLSRQKTFNTYTWTLAYRTMIAEKRLAEIEIRLKRLESGLNSTVK